MPSAIVRVGFLFGLLLSTTASAAPVEMTASDSDQIYRWRGASCTIGLSDLHFRTNDPVDHNAVVQLTFRNIKDSLDPLAINRTLTPLTPSRLVYRDRADFEWSFQPARNRATCAMTIKKLPGDQLALWGTCERLTPINPQQTFANTIEIPEATPINCVLRDTSGQD